MLNILNMMRAGIIKVLRGRSEIYLNLYLSFMTRYQFDE